MRAHSQRASHTQKKSLQCSKNVYQAATSRVARSRHWRDLCLSQKLSVEHWYKHHQPEAERILTADTAVCCALCSTGPGRPALTLVPGAARGRHSARLSGTSRAGRPARTEPRLFCILALVVCYYIVLMLFCYIVLMLLYLIISYVLSARR